jgi:hypothetical protein
MPVPMTRGPQEERVRIIAARVKMTISCFFMEDSCGKPPSDGKSSFMRK